MFNDFSYLYVEDDTLSRQIMSMIIRSAMGSDNGEFFEDSHNFMERVKKLPFQPDIFLLDIYILPTDGFEMCAMLREDPDFSHSKIIAVTASLLDHEMIRLRQCGFDGAIIKPLSVTTLPSLLERILGGEAVWG